MIYKLFGYLNAQATWRVREIRRLAGDRGQGTVEYVGLILLVSLLMVGMVAAMKGFNRSLSKTGYYLKSWTLVAPIAACWLGLPRCVFSRERSMRGEDELPWGAGDEREKRSDHAEA